MSDRKAPHRRRPHEIKVRMNDEEYAAFIEKVRESGQSQQNFILNSINSAEFAPQEMTDAVLGILHEMSSLHQQARGIGVNINQIAKNSNIERLTGDYDSVSSLSDIQDDVSDLKERCNELWQSLRSLIHQNHHTVL